MRDVAPSGRAELSRQAHRAVSVIPAQQTFRSDRSDGRMALADRLLTIFDVEGTLVDSTALTLRCWQQTLRALQKLTHPMNLPKYQLLIANRCAKVFHAAHCPTTFYLYAAKHLESQN